MELSDKLVASSAGGFLMTSLGIILQDPVTYGAGLAILLGSTCEETYLFLEDKNRDYSDLKMNI